jgi:uncharacterized protein (TIGR03437 family)
MKTKTVSCVLLYLAIILPAHKTAAQIPLSCGQTLSGAIASPSEIVQYNFTIPAGGDLIALNLASTTANFTPRFRLYNPAGAQINTNTVYATEAVTTAGTYRVTVSYSSGSVTAGGFKLTRQSLRNPCNATALKCGDNLTGRLEQLSELDVYTFNGTTGDPIKLQIGSSRANDFNPAMRLYAPDGDSLNLSATDIGRTLPQTGLYKVLVLQSSGDGRVGDYGLTLQNTRTPCNTQVLSCGALRYGAIRSLAAFDTYTFAATANEPYMLWIVATTKDANSQLGQSGSPYFNLEMEVYSPTGTFLFSTTSGNSGEIVSTPTVSGTYTLIVHSASGDETGDYQINFQRTKNPCNSLLLSSCQRVKAAISSQAEIDTYTINGTIGQAIPLQAIGETTLFTPDANFYDPDGGKISAGRLLTKAGAYTLIVRAQGGTGMTGNYTVSVGSSTITVTSPLNGEMLLAGTTERIAWEASSTSTGTTFDILLSTDGGATFPTTIATGIPRTTLFYQWNVPATLVTSRARIRIVSRDTSGSSCVANSEADFFVVGLGAGSAVNYKYDDLNQLIEAAYDNGVKFTYIYDAVGNRLSETVTGSAASVSAASYSGAALAGESIAAVFGSGLATSVEVANTVPLPTTLAGSTVRFRDSAGKEQLAQLFFVAPGQINYLVPSGLALGSASTVITSGNGTLSAGIVQIAAVAPGLFSANASGQGVAAAVVLRVKANGAQSYEPVSRFDQSVNRFVTAPIDLGPDGDQLFLIAFGTGIRGRSNSSAVTARIGGIDAAVLFAGSQGALVGLDQVNLSLPRSLMGKGEVGVQLTVDGRLANTVTINIK